MENYFKVSVALIFSIALLSCQEDPVFEQDSNQSLSEKERLLCKNWQYLKITIYSTDYKSATEFLEPLEKENSFRDELKRRQINYGMDRRYQLQWRDRGRYQLGTDGDPNWQPNTGFWQLNETEDSLIHNQSMGYAAKYHFYVSEDTLIRKSFRHMSQAGPTWFPDEEILFTETFVSMD